MKMTVAAALRRIKKIKGELSTLDARIRQSACYIEGKEPPFSFEESMSERERKVGQLSMLSARVSVSNASTTFEFAGGPVVVVGAIKRLEEIKSQIALLNTLPIRDRAIDTEFESDTFWDDNLNRSVVQKKAIVHRSAMTRAAQAAQIASLATQFEDLNVALEACNHSTFIEA